MSSSSNIDACKYVHTEVISEEILQKNIDYLRTKNIIIPTFEQLAHPETIPPKIVEELKKLTCGNLILLTCFESVGIMTSKPEDLVALTLSTFLLNSLA